ncbi:MAG: glycosyltransferase family 2 protein [Planctomycetota bacterium]
MMTTLQTTPSSTMDEKDPAVALESVWVIIPALNEEASIGSVLQDLPDVGRVIVVDNGSRDQTLQIASSKGADVVQEPRRGYGAACLRGIAQVEKLIGNGARPPEVIVFADADYSDHVHTLSTLIEPIQTGVFDFVLGSRLLGKREPGAMPPQSVWGNRLACFLMRLRFGFKFTELGPFRAISWSSLGDLGMCDQNFGWTIEMQIKAIQNGLRILEVPTDYRNRVGTSKISGTFSGTIKAGYKILYTVAKYSLPNIRKR